MSILGSASPWALNIDAPAVRDLDLKYSAHLRGVRLLCDLLVQAGDVAMPLIAWTVSPSGNLAGRVYGDDELVRARFGEWMDFLGAHRLSDDRSYFGTLTLRGCLNWNGCEINLYAYLDEASGGDDR